MDSKELERLQKIKQAKDASRERRKGKEKGLYIVFTGLGKGKTSAAMNLVYRHLAHNLSVAVVQFVKNSAAYPDGDRLLLTRLQGLGFPVQIHTLGAGFTWETQNPQTDREATAQAWQVAQAYIQNPEINLVVLDELHIAIKHSQLTVEEVLPVIQKRPYYSHVVSTGRYAPQELIDHADLVSEIKLIKHPIHQGIPAQLGIEF
ncbi:MAG: cob(I)yrinic acid a,c-diamide adenosyltransferase [Pseudanabaenaceae cyanobacterium SKYGB_i_bin29]|nr:cob(I)yrinic acid a,c-diamide adenosyltransferase [Pseudanabaenaceae cyanobacterium SKYG29]MDW8421407.1 cob(I)yrinic acid a,c-diamide adenosyltransferase [Pseudanabaenaceae cyanobacterium SKYGB_i_bin29]